MTCFKFITFCVIIFFSFTRHVYLQQEKFPDWAKGIVWYQIFPERFCNGDTANDPVAEKVFIHSGYMNKDWKISRWTSNWFGQNEWEKKSNRKFRDNLFLRRYGGDIKGIINKLDYLKELGVGAIYLNPVFDAVSLHKYDGSTYHHIDVNFGTNPEEDSQLINKEIPDDASTWNWTSADKLFLKLIDEVHSRGMKIIIDGVFNHTGTQFWAFQDIIKNGKNSKYADWYKIKSFDDPKTKENEFDYKGWWNVKSLPEFNRTENDLQSEVKKYIFNSTCKWMDPNKDGNPSDGIDGWRLDVANEVPKGFWKDWNELVKSINSRAIIIGELWDFSPDLVCANGVFDALMNYNFAYAVKDFFIADTSKIKTSEFIKRLEQIEKTYPRENLHLLQNLLDSHDTERLVSMIANPDRGYDRDADERNPNYNPAKPSSQFYEKMKMIVAFQMLYKGAPMIYYGDEAGMWGADDPHDRKPMIWSELIYDDEIIDSSSGFQKGYGKYKVYVNDDLLDYYKKIIAIRNKSKAIKSGNVSFVLFDDEHRVFAFKRGYENENILVVFNLGNNSCHFSYEVNTSKIFKVEFENAIPLTDTEIKSILKPNSFEIYKY